MKKKSMIIILFMLIMIMTAVPVYAKPSKKTVANAYKTYRTSKGIKQYKLVDIDKNGIKEMIYYKDLICGFCTYSAKTKKVIPLKELDIGRSTPFVYYSTKHHRIILYTLTTKSSDTYVYKVKGTKALLKNHVIWSWSDYYIGSKKVTYEDNAAWRDKIKKTYKKIEFNR